MNNTFNSTSHLMIVFLIFIDWSLFDLVSIPVKTEVGSMIILEKGIVGIPTTIYTTLNQKSSED